MDFGAIFIIRIIERKKYNNINKFFIITLIFSIFEYITSLLLEVIFGMRWWDYSNELFNINGRICLVFSIVWGIIGLIFVDKIHPFIKEHTEKRLKYIDYKIKEKIARIMIFIVGSDIIISSCKYLIYNTFILK